MSEAKGMWEGLMDFSFRRYATPRMLKFLYAIHPTGRTYRRSCLGGTGLSTGSCSRFTRLAPRTSWIRFVDSVLSRRAGSARGGVPHGRGYSSWAFRFSAT